ncbi:putative dolichyl-phosphate-mannose--protein mannosyltransferase [compost metagenome]
MLLVVPGNVSGENTNLVENPGFEQGSASAPSIWEIDRWSLEEGASYFEVVGNEAHTGTRSARIEIVKPDHAKWVQTVEVEPNSNYVISGWIKVLELGDGEIGANLFPLGIGGAFPQVKDPLTDWKKVEFYGTTGREQTEFILAAGIGGYGRLNTGIALFDDITVEKVDRIPEGIQPVALQADTVPVNDESVNEASVSTFVSPLNMAIVSVLFSLLFCWLYYTMIRREHPLALGRNGRMKFGTVRGWLIGIIAAAFILRMIIAVTVPPFETDMNTFMGWAQHAVEKGLGSFYSEDIFADYPPGYVYVLYILGWIRTLFDLNYGDVGTILLFKLPAMLADLVAGYLIYVMASKKSGGKSLLGLALAAMYLFNPAVIINSAGWGQVDAFYVVFLISGIISLTERRMERSAVWFAIATLIKPQTLIFTPVWLLAAWHYRKWKSITVSILYGLITFTLLALPFFWNNGGLSALLKLYKTTLSSYPYASVNAFNLYALFGYNWASIEDRWLLFSFSTWGIIFILFAVAYAIYISIRKRGKSLGESYFIALALIVIMFVLGTKMHERYMFPVMLLSLFSFLQLRDRRLLYLFLGFSITQFVNVAYVLSYLNMGLSPENDGIVLLCSLANVLLLFYTLYLGFDIYVRRRRIAFNADHKGERQKRDQSILQNLQVLPERSSLFSGFLRLRGLDWLWIGIVTLLYTLVAVYQLGSFKGPDTVWKPAQPTSFYVDFGEAKQIERVNFFGGTSTGEWKIDFSHNVDIWEKTIDVPDDYGGVFAWKSQNVGTEARYARITVEHPGISLHEMSFYEPGKDDQPIAITQIVPSDPEGDNRAESAVLLFDEQATSIRNYGYLNSTYFDEIYHARTAYEYWHNQSPYETTHPPLGKWFIGIGIQLFGLSPWGWRIVGTLFGAAMLPLIYLLARLLFNSRKYAMMAMVLLAAEFMHFTQTRIATIDVYAVFFIMLMFYFMKRYVSMNFYKQKLWKTLLPLFGSGLFFGVGVSSKWIVLYGGAGLAIMLAMSLYSRYKEYAAAKRQLNGSGRDLQNDEKLYLEITNTFVRKTLITLASCILFFIVIPIMIYAASYIPALSATDQGFTISNLVQAQKDMFDYHSHLVGSHPFASTWWEWPFMKRPVWFYGESGEAAGLGIHNVSSIVTMGNPLIWWSGILALAAAVWISIKRRDSRMYVVWIAYLSQYIPWMLVSRETFLYHYFAMIPFLILAIVYVAKIAEDRWPKIRWVRYIYVGMAVMLFIVFYPVLSGMEVSSEYVEHVLRWFPSWVF